MLQIGRVDLVILLECEEDLCRQRLSARSKDGKRIDDNKSAISRRLTFFMENTLAVVHHFEKAKKLVKVAIVFSGFSFIPI